MAPSVPHTHADAALHMKQIALDNQRRKIRRLRAKLTTERRESAATKEGLETKVSSLERDLQIHRCDNHSLRNKVTLCHTDIDRRISQLVEAKKEHKTNQLALEASHKTIAGLTEIGIYTIQEAEDTIQEQHLIIEALVEEKASLLQKIQGLQEDNGAPAPFDDEWEEEPNMADNRRSDSNNGGEGSSNSRGGLSREDLMAIATIVATTLQGLGTHGGLDRGRNVSRWSNEPDQAVRVEGGAPRSMDGASNCSDQFSLVSPRFETRSVRLGPDGTGSGPAGKAPAVVAGARRTITKTRRWSRRRMKGRSAV
ncbi:hypothetical protein F511_30152 [Dorcoceras hygrometricum]|uniref:Uncharacterized protein n=1 Tax=Dorcoceras hygrometricum TaxID=472368 RepID=A0A2Z7A8V2_9LAMI|nr:hypothetical protein F511_30152 [Dorcoceras hygrometricum]